MVIWPSKRDDPVFKNFTKQNNIWICHHKTGFITTDLFEYYVLNILIPFIIQKRLDSGRSNSRSLLFLDSHASRINKNLMTILKNNRIDVVTFLSHSSHLCQPLDLGVNGIFKKKIAQILKVETENPMILKNQIMDIVQTASHCALSPPSIKSCFVNSGLHPYNPNIVLSGLVEGNIEVTEHFKKKK
jgi:hypothetical protein